MNALGNNPRELLLVITNTGFRIGIQRIAYLGTGLNTFVVNANHAALIRILLQIMMSWNYASALILIMNVILDSLLILSLANASP